MFVPWDKVLELILISFNHIVRDMIKITTLIVFTSIMTATTTATTCGDKMITLDPNLGLGKLNCIDAGEYSRNGCRRLREDGNLICSLTPLDKPRNGKCYHMKCDWTEQDNYKLTWDIKPPHDTIQVTMTPEMDLSPEWTLFLVLIFLFLWIPFACANPELAFIICFSCNNDRGTRHGSGSKLG